MAQNTEMEISKYLVDFCSQLKAALPDDIYSCKVYGGELDSDATDYINFNVNKKAQAFITLRNVSLIKGETLLGTGYFVVALAVITDRETDGYSLRGMDIAQRVGGFINNSDCLNAGTNGRPLLSGIDQITNKIKDKKMYNIIHVNYEQKIILKQDFNN